MGGLQYTVSAATPQNYSAIDAFPTSVPVSIAMGMPNTNDTVTPSSLTFKFQSAVVSTNFTTYSQAEWGAKPRGQNAAYNLATYFNIAEPDNAVVVGGAKTVTMTGSAPVMNFLPQGGLPLPLDKSYTDPVMKAGQWKPHMRLGSLAGETLALQLNVDFSNAGLTRPGLGLLHLASGAFAGQTVNQVLAVANCVLGGGTLAACGVPSTIQNQITYLGPKGALIMKYDAVEDTVERINKNFLGGTVNRLFLVQ
jgi:hypothetical protein